MVINFQREMKEDLKKMKMNDSEKIIIAADKTRNHYKCDLPRYEKMLAENISKEYKKANETELNEVNLKASRIAKKENLEKRMQTFTPGESYITIKDHKTGFPGKISCRLINPAKTDIGKLSKVILQEKVAELRESLQLNQWKSTNEVLEWFSALKYTKEAVKNQKIKLNYFSFCRSVQFMSLI